MIVLLIKEKGMSAGMKVAIFFLSIGTAFLLGVMWGRPELVEETSRIIQI